MAWFINSKERKCEMENINLLSTVVAYLVPTILGGLVGFFSAKFRKNAQKEKAIEEGVQALLRNELIRRFREYEVKGELTILDQENMQEMYEQYKNLGGNGTVKHLMEELFELPTKIIKG